MQLRVKVQLQCLLCNSIITLKVFLCSDANEATELIFLHVGEVQGKEGKTGDKLQIYWTFFWHTELFDSIENGCSGSAQLLVQGEVARNGKRCVSACAGGWGQGWWQHPWKGSGSTTWPVLSQGSQHTHIATQQGSVDNMPRQGISNAAHSSR